MAVTDDFDIEFLIEISISRMTPEQKNYLRGITPSRSAEEKFNLVGKYREARWNI